MFIIYRDQTCINLPIKYDTNRKNYMSTSYTIKEKLATQKITTDNETVAWDIGHDIILWSFKVY